MRSKLGAVLAFLGAFLVVVAVMAQTYASGQLKKTPIDVSTVTHLDGSAVLSGETFDVKATSTTHTDSQKSDDNVAVWQNSSCLVKDLPDTPDCVSADDPQKRLISASIDNFATDRVTGVAVNSPKYLPADATPHSGLVNKWPFDAQKKTYSYWYGTTGQAVDAVYDRTEKLQGLECYVYKVSVADAPVEIAAGVNGKVTDDTEIWIEPVTGAIVNQVTHQERVLDDGSPVLNLDLAFSDAQVKTSVEDGKTNKSQLLLVTHTVPLVGYLVGIPALLIGIALLVLGRRNRGGDKANGTTGPVRANA